MREYAYTPSTLIQTLYFHFHFNYSILMLQKTERLTFCSTEFTSADYKICFLSFWNTRVRRGALLCNFHRRYLIPITTLLFSNRRPFTLATTHSGNCEHQLRFASIGKVCVRLKVVSKHNSAIHFMQFQILLAHFVHLFNFNGIPLRQWLQ